MGITWTFKTKDTGINYTFSVDEGALHKGFLTSFKGGEENQHKWFETMDEVISFMVKNVDKVLGRKISMKAFLNKRRALKSEVVEFFGKAKDLAYSDAKQWNEDLNDDGFILDFVLEKDGLVYDNEVQFSFEEGTYTFMTKVYKDELDGEVVKEDIDKYDITTSEKFMKDFQEYFYKRNRKGVSMKAFLNKRRALEVKGVESLTPEVVDGYIKVIQDMVYSKNEPKIEKKPNGFIFTQEYPVYSEKHGIDENLTLKIELKDGVAKVYLSDSENDDGVIVDTIKVIDKDGDRAPTHMFEQLLDGTFRKIRKYVIDRYGRPVYVGARESLKVLASKK